MSMFKSWEDEQDYIIDTLREKGYGLCSIKLQKMAGMSYPVAILYVMFEPLLCCQRLDEAGAKVAPVKLKYTKGFRGIHVINIDSLAPAVKEIPPLEVTGIEIGQNAIFEKLQNDGGVL